MQKGLAILIQVHDGPTNKLAGIMVYEKVAEQIDRFLMQNESVDTDYYTVDIKQVKGV